MRTKIKEAIADTVQGMVNLGLGTSFTEKELKALGVQIPEITISAKEIKRIRARVKLSQSVFAKVLNVSASTVRQWEQGTRVPTGSTKVLLDLLKKEPHLLDYRISA
ncbi:MAG: helix-turn-helix domain-containing protein [Candidatus Anammoxibacter sp.]